MLLLPETLDQYSAELADALEDERFVDAAGIALRLSPSRVAKTLYDAPVTSAAPFLLTTEPHLAGSYLAQISPRRAAEILTEMDTNAAADLFVQIPSDHAMEVMPHLDEDEREELLSRATPLFRQELTDLGRYPPSSAGSFMTPRYIAILSGTTVGETLNALLASPHEVERSSSYVYVLDPDRKLQGVLSVKDLMRYDPASTVDEQMNPDVVAVHAADPAARAAKLIRNRRITMVPVIDDAETLLGVVTFDDAMDIMAEDVVEQFAAIAAGTGEESFFTPPMGAVRRRLPWMSGNVILNLGAVAVIASFESTIAQVAILAAFLPMITDMGGNVGIQSLSVAIRSLALGEARLRDFWRAARKEVVIGLVNGVALGALFAIIAYFWQGNAWIGILAGIALGINVLVAGVVGGVLPFLIKRLGKDPAMMTGPVLTTITDITGVTIYLGLCTAFLSRVLGG